MAISKKRKQPPRRTATPNPTPKKRGRPPKKRPEAAQEEETTESPNRDRVPAEKALKCSICLDTSRCRKMKILPCKHKFHDRCVNKWFELEIKCPLCRSWFFDL